MEQEHQKLKILRSFDIRSDSFKLRLMDSSINRDHDSDIDCQGCTSLKDVIHSPPAKASSLEPIAFDASTISIRNVLVKHAASAYVQSAIVSSRDQSFLTEFIDRVKDRGAAFRSCCQTYVRKPLQCCFGAIFRFFRYMINHMARVWRGRVAIR